MANGKKPDVSRAMVKQDDLSKIADQIEYQGGYRENIGNYTDRAESLSDVLRKIKEKGGAVSKMVSGTGKIGKKLGALALGPIGGAAMAAYDALDTEALADSTDGGLDPEQMADVKAMRDLQQTGELTPERLTRIRSMVGSARTPASIPLPDEEIVDTAPIPASRANALTGVDNTQAALDRQLASDLSQSDSLDPQAQRQLRLRKLFQGQTK
jgi:hypothetical protein